MSVADIKVVGSIDLTPTWEGILPIFLAVMEDGDAEGRATIRGELLRMAKLADLYVKEHAPREPEA